MSYAQVFPRCPDCGHETRLWRDTQETNRGQPNTWWCPECGTVVRARYKEGAWDVYDLAPDGSLIRRAEACDLRPWAAQAIRQAMGKNLHPSAKVVFTYLVATSGAGGVTQVSLKGIAAGTAISRPQAWRARQELADNGMLSWARTDGPLGVCAYAVVPPDEWVCTAETGCNMNATAR